MNSIESPLNTAHQHAANADDFMSQGLLIPASEQHNKAAQKFQECIEASNDEHAKRTLRMLYNEHSKAFKDLERRIAKMREENKDPSLPQNTYSKRPTAPPSAPRPSGSPPPQSRNRMSESSNPVDESFMLLGQRSDPGDLLFNQFWKVTTELLENMSQPAAFASAPIGYPPPQRDASSSSDTDVEDGFATRITKKIGDLTKRASDNTSFMTARDGSFSRGVQSAVPISRQDFDEVLADDDDDLAESFCLIPSGEEPAALRKENAALKSEVSKLQEQLAAAQTALRARKETDEALRVKLLNVRGEAQRAMTASAMGQVPPRPIPDFGSLNVPVPQANTPPPGRDRESQLTKRVRELEEDVKVLRAENESQKQMIVRFRERWNGLKESAKRKKEAKAAAAAASSPVREKIIEEPEPEDEDIKES